jgi:hypothetical protein
MTEFQNCIVSRNGDIPWPPSLPDLSACDFLWDHLKSKVYTHCSHSIEEPKERIHEEIAGICSEMLYHVTGNMHGRSEECLCRDIRYLKDIIKIQTACCVFKESIFVIGQFFLAFIIHNLQNL